MKGNRKSSSLFQHVGYQFSGIILASIFLICSVNYSFAAELGAATTVVVASGVGMPISTTHTLVGAILGVGMAISVIGTLLAYIEYVSQLREESE